MTEHLRTEDELGMDYFSAFALGKIGIEDQEIAVKIIETEDQLQIQAALDFAKAYKRITLEQSEKICTLERSILVDNNGNRIDLRPR